jgi:plasmid stability protein
MASLVPVTIEVEETVLQALRLRAAKEGVSLSAVLQAILQRTLKAEIDEVSGVPPLAAVIQNHHDRLQEALRQQAQAPKPESDPPPALSG